ncbi:MAG: YqeG family HAD IIIA-type phosphatase [Clostridiales bacterium]|nr:YqeG family HAD IIIA-type phosphatase [Clostridiales bacterium]
MIKEFFPYEYLNSIFDIDYAKLYDKGYRGLIFDIDNTLVHHGGDSTEEVNALFKKVHSTGFKTVLLTNNDEVRVQRFIRGIDTLYICDADKPDTRNYLKALKVMGINKEEAVCVGDQIFTDILGANRSGIASILVDFIRSGSEKKIGKLRYAEKIIIKLYQMSRAYKSRLGDIQDMHNKGLVD